MIIKFNLEDSIYEKLEKEAEKLGMKLNAYIQFILGKHVIETTAQEKAAKRKEA